MSRRTAVATAVLLAAAAPALTAGPASATTQREVVDVLRVTSTVDPDALTWMYPGSRVNWIIDAGIEGAPTGDLTLRILASGDMVDHEKGLLASLRSCAEPWQDVDSMIHLVTDPLPTCASGQEDRLVLFPLATLPENLVIPARKVSRDQREYLLLCLVLPDDAPDELQGATSFFAMSITATGEELDATPTPPRPAPVPGGGPSAGTGTTGGGTPLSAGGGGTTVGASSPGAFPGSLAGTGTGGASLLSAPLPQRLARTGLDALPALAGAGLAVVVGLLISRLARTSSRRRTS